MSQPAIGTPEVRSELAWFWIMLHRKYFEKYVLDNALVTCFEAVSRIHFYNICSRLVIFHAFTWRSRHNLKCSKDSTSQHWNERKHYPIVCEFKFVFGEIMCL